MFIENKTDVTESYTDCLAISTSGGSQNLLDICTSVLHHKETQETFLGLAYHHAYSLLYQKCVDLILIDQFGGNWHFTNRNMFDFCMLTLYFASFNLV